MEDSVSAPDELNELVNLGKENIRIFVKAYLQRSLSSGNEEEKCMAMAVSSLLSLSLKKALPDIDVQRIRTLIIEENLAVLSAAAENDPRIIRLFALATGRVTQAREYIAAIGRVGQTYLDDAAAMNRYLLRLQGAVVTMERAAVKIFRNEEGKLVLLDLGNYEESAIPAQEMGRNPEPIH